MKGSLNRLILGRIGKHILAVLLLIEAIFLSETLTSLLEAVLSYDAGTVPLGTLLLLTSPEIFDFALPLATVTGVYLSLFSAREKNELVICSAAGIAPARIAAAALLAGAAGCAASLVVAGFVAPMAERATRGMLWGLQAAYVLEQLDQPAAGLTERTINGWSVVSTGAQPGGGGGRLLIRHPMQDGTWRVSLADGWTSNGPDAAGNYTIVFNGVQVFQSTDVLQALGAGTASGTADRPDGAPKLTIGHASSVSVPVSSGTLIGVRDQTLGLKELTIAGMILQAEQEGGESGKEAAERLGEIVGRALLCPLAALFALAGVSVARPGLTGYLALPGAAAAVMAADAGLQAVLRPAAESGFPTLAAWALVLLAGTVAAAGALLRFRSSGIVVPAFGRA